MKMNLEHVDFQISKKEILKDINLEIKEKSFMGVIGPNGSGKSSLLKCIYGVNKPTSGKIWIGGEDLLAMKRRDRAKRIAVLAQETAEHFDFSVLEIVKMGRFPHKKTLENYSKEDLKIVDGVLEKMNLGDYIHRSFSTLSGGEKQRVLIARVLAQECDFIILDEPTNHLDIGHQLEIMKIIKNLNVTVLAAIHDMNMASLFCDEIAVMKKGCLTKHGSVKDVMTPETLKSTFNINADIHYNKENGISHIVYKI